MGNGSTSRPSKEEVALSILDKGSLLIHLDPRRNGVVVPSNLRMQPRLTLQVGRSLAPPIPDLVVDRAGISATLSFNRSPFWCSVPWSSVFALVGTDGHGRVWEEDVPPDAPQEPHDEDTNADDEPEDAGAGAMALHCSFCGKSQREVRKLIAGPSVYICDECVYLCVDILNEGSPEAQ